MRWKFWTSFFVAGLTVGSMFAQSATPELQLIASDYGRHFLYSVSHPELVREAWIEILDRPLLVGKKSVAVQANGTLDWDWDRSALNVYEQPDDNLVLSVWDPNGESIILRRYDHVLAAGRCSVLHNGRCTREG